MTTGFKNIRVERYPNPEEIGYSANIEGEDTNGNRWIMWLDKDGRPEIFWPEREPDGAVIGEGIRLDRRPGQFAGVFKALGVPDDSDVDDNEVVSMFPVYWPEGTVFEYDEQGRVTNDSSNCMRGILFAVVPGDEGGPRERISKFIRAIFGGTFAFPDFEVKDGWSTDPDLHVQDFGTQELHSEGGPDGGDAAPDIGPTAD